MGNERNQRCRQLRTWQCSKRTNHKIKLRLSTYVRFSNFVLCFLVQKPTTSTRAILLHNVELVAHTCPRLQKPDSTNKQLWSLNNNNQVTFSHSTSLFTGELYISTSTHQKDIKISTTNEAMGHERNQRSCHTRTRQHSQRSYNPNRIAMPSTGLPSHHESWILVPKSTTSTRAIILHVMGGDEETCSRSLN